MKIVCVAAGLLFAAVSAAAASTDPLALSYKDWELACDNTHTCRAAGYQAEDSRSEPVSMLITREAGPATAVDIELQVGGDDDVRGPLRFQVGKVVVDTLKADAAQFTPEQVAAVMPELRKGDVARIDGAGRQWTLSLAGLHAVLLKMDEVQGRIDTPGALVKRGSKPESSVPAAVPMPVVRVKMPVAPRPGDDALAARIFPTLKLDDAREQCNNSDRVQAASLEVSRLTDRRVLLSLSCGMGAYNFSSLLWIANDKPPYAAVALEANGQFDRPSGSVTALMKMRGVGDCWSSETWHFDGTQFVRSAKSADYMCRGFAGGAWTLSRYVTRTVSTPAATPSKP